MSYLPPSQKWARIARLGCLLCLLAVVAHAQSGAARHRVLIDRSGSMEGYFVTGKLQEVQSLLSDLSGASGDSYYFIDRQLVPTRQEGVGFGIDTYLSDSLDNALRQQPAPSVLWIITDNQPSAGNQTASDQDIARFYDRLRSDQVKRLYFFPLKLDFKGKLYREDGHTLLTSNYSGKRGLLVYALLLDESARDEFDRVTAEFHSRYRSAAGETQRILIKPLNQDTITARLIPGNKFRIENGNQLTAGEFDESAPLKGHFTVELTSQMGEMKISTADIDVSVPEKFRTGDFTESEIKPQFTPHDIKDFEPQNKVPVEIDLNAPGVHIRRNLLSWWNCITHNRGDITGRIQIEIKALGQNFNVVSNLANEFSTSRDIYNDSSERVQSRIYKLDELVQKMLPARQVNIRPRIGDSVDGTIPVRLVVRYPKWPGILLALIILALLLLAYAIYRLFGRGRFYRLTWDGGRYRACPDFRLWPFVGRRIELDRRTAATIKKSLGGIRVSASNGYKVDDGRGRFVHPGGTDFNISQSSDGAGVNFYFSSTTAALTGGSAAGKDEDGILGGVTYVSGAGNGVSAVYAASSPPPIRKPTVGGATGGGASSPGTADADDDHVNLDDLFP